MGWLGKSVSLWALALLPSCGPSGTQPARDRARDRALCAPSLRALTAVAAYLTAHSKCTNFGANYDESILAAVTKKHVFSNCYAYLGMQLHPGHKTPLGSREHLLDHPEKPGAVATYG